MSGKAIRETLAALAVVTSLVFVGYEIRQSTISARASAYQEIGLATSDLWMILATDPEYAELQLMAFDSTRWGEIDGTGWHQMAATLTSVMRLWETTYLQVEEGLLREDAMGRLGFAVDPHVYFQDAFDRLWQEVRPRMNAEFAAYIEQQFGATP